MTVRAKFKVAKIESSLNGYQEMRTIVLVPVYGATDDPTHENAAFWTYTPSGEIRLGTINPEAWQQFDLGASYYIDFTPAPKD